MSEKQIEEAKVISKSNPTGCNETDSHIEYVYAKSNTEQIMCKVDNSKTLQERNFDKNVEVDMYHINMDVKDKEYIAEHK